MTKNLDTCQPQWAYCDHCHEFRAITHQVTSEILDMRVCTQCALIARGLPKMSPGQLTVTPVGGRP